ncbi:hypothetical protein [Oceanimonas smirnovii]|uniref:hypothetical protein n=1 Tax=Oceanimonas smirnovii TaxID=264574 RepID=UPI0003A61D3D|nr:hypothetical protein [Oceanimonas smirnovii]
MTIKDTLYLHVGWSKTGTSAIQKQIQHQYEDFLSRGILYPQTLQWADHSHHPFALSFQSSGTYKSDMNPPQALEKLKFEMMSTPAKDVLLSSELSPFYFNNPAFKNFAKEYFSEVKVIFTVRKQSELLLSLFNQLVKDPNVRYRASLFNLAMRNISWLNYFENIKRWASVVGKENIIVVPYSKNITEDFLRIFDIEKTTSNENTNDVVNPSLPTRCLSLVQEKTKIAKDNADFLVIRNNIINKSKDIPFNEDTYILFSVPEQQSFDHYFSRTNQALSTIADIDLTGLTNQEYKEIKVIHPDFNI